MPKLLERKLISQAKKKGFGKKRIGAYVYGNKTMQSYLKKKK